MDIIGTYQVRTLIGATPDGPRMVTREEYIEAAKSSGNSPREIMQSIMTANGRLKISEDGKLYALSPIPEGVPEADIQAAVAAGQIVMAENGFCVMKKSDVYDWKEEDGKFLYDTRQEREVLGEKISAWDDLKFDGETVTFADGLAVYEKI